MGLDSPDEKERKAGNKWAKLGEERRRNIFGISLRTCVE
jgi:hypothetical protein